MNPDKPSTWQMKQDAALKEVVAEWAQVVKKLDRILEGLEPAKLRLGPPPKSNARQNDPQGRLPSNTREKVRKDLRAKRAQCEKLIKEIEKLVGTWGMGKDA